MATQAAPRAFAAGELTHTMNLVAPIGVLDEAAEVTVDEHVRIKVRVLPLAFQARERAQVGGFRTDTLYTLATHYREDVKASYVWVENCCTQRQFQILAVIPSDRRDALEMTCVTNG